MNDYMMALIYDYFDCADCWIADLNDYMMTLIYDYFDDADCCDSLAKRLSFVTLLYCKLREPKLMNKPVSSL